MCTTGQIVFLSTISDDLAQISGIFKFFVNTNLSYVYFLTPVTDCVTIHLKHMIIFSAIFSIV